MPKEPEAPVPAIAGPSFLGLNDAQEVPAAPIADTDAPAPSSNRRWTWVAVAALLVVVVLAGLEWRAQGNLTGNVPVEGIRAKLQNAWRSYSPAPQGSSNATSTRTVEEQTNTQSQETAASSSAPNSALTGKSAASDTNLPPNSANQQAANSQKVAESKPAPATGGSRAEAPPKAATEAGTAAKTTAKPAAENAGNTEVPPRKGPPGAEELAKANHASDSAAAAAWLWKSTAKGNPEAPVRLAGMYVKGEGVPRSCEQAMVLLKTAATKPNAQARNRLGAMYDSGTCVDRDLVKAYHWLTSALAADPASEWALQNRERIWREMTPEERGVAKEYQ